jgi:L-asparaginase II
LLAQQVRSGLVETVHEGAAAVIGRDGALVAWSGDIDRPFYLRSAAKPFQAMVSQECGAGLAPLELALACASHLGFPVHVALAESMLAAAGLDESALGCPRDWPLGEKAQLDVVRAGVTRKRKIWHNCSGKHAGFLRACVAQGWPVDSYLDPDHPLQRKVIEEVSELGEYPVEQVGVDGCGAPVLRTTVRAMARLFLRLATEERLAPVFQAMHRYPALVGGNGEGDTEVAIATNSAAKGGAAGCVGIAVEDRFGIAVKSWDGLDTIANAAAVAVLEELRVTTSTASQALEPILRPPVMGGGTAVGVVEPRLVLERA